MNKQTFPSKLDALARSRAVIPTLGGAACVLTLARVAGELSGPDRYDLAAALMDAGILLSLAALLASCFLRKAAAQANEDAMAASPGQPQEKSEAPPKAPPPILRDTGEAASRDAAGTGGPPIAVSMSLRLRPLAPLFMKTAFDNARNMRQALDANDLETIRRLGHSLKGAARTYGLDELGERGLALEEAAGGADGARLKGLLDELDDYMGKIRIAFVKEKDAEQGDR